MNTHTPKITVLMSVYNGELYLRESIDSILRQTYTDFEFIIINDGSTDSTQLIIDKYAAKDKRIIKIQNTERIHLTKSLNLGLKKAKGEYIARQDADDISLPERLQFQIEYMTQNVEVGVLGTSAEYIDGIGNPIQISLKQTNRNLIGWELLFHNPLIHSSIIFNSSLVRSIGGYDEEFLRSQDYALWSKCSSFTVITKLPNILLKHRTRYKPIHNVINLENINTSIKIMHNNIQSLLNESVPINHVKLLRLVKTSPLKSRTEYKIAFSLLNQIYKAYLKDQKFDRTTMDFINSDLNQMVNKWKGYPTYNYRLPEPLMRLQTVLIYRFQKHYQQQNIIGNILRNSFRNPKIEKRLGLFSMKYWNSNN